ncbi:major facilitator superfamily protein [Sphingobium sp. SYK-6]|uniref:MFS transporter n=1 Tax=Sphingobium sp. (strain NBRC 103272 / SYK-6) TaxID=627192 RepID=UPI0002276C6F|nr:MFS transporter [Sphingobium sp. SYK-6]BAK65553.1 major facilitator superfamily protein [Sphingobium sp. SYK-6]
MQASLRLLAHRKFLPLFVTQFLGAFNDNLFKTAMILFATYEVFRDPQQESNFNALATGLFILPFFLLSALSGQLADNMDKARIIRMVKLAEIFIMLVGATGLLVSGAYPMVGVALMLGAVFAMGIHSTFFGPIKYAVLPQHLEQEHVLGGTGLVEAGTYVAILAGTIVAGWISPVAAAGVVIGVAIIGYLSGRMVPPAPRLGPPVVLDFNPFRASWRLISATMHIRRLFLAIMSISFFWMIATVLIIIFPPMVKNDFTATKEVASMFLAIFSIGVAVGSVAINRLLQGHVSARYAPISVVIMAAFVWFFQFASAGWAPAPDGALYSVPDFLAAPHSWRILLALFGIAVFGGMFVVPLYAFLTTTVSRDQTARTVAANNVVNSGAMVFGALVIMGATGAGLSSRHALLIVCGMCFVSALMAMRLQRACDREAGSLPARGGRAG